MPLKHYYQGHHYYFITTITKNRTPIFEDTIACELFLNILTYHKFNCNYNIIAFVIMPDHAHIVIQPTNEENNISLIMKKIKGSFSRCYNKKYHRHGAVFQQGFYDRIVKDEKELEKTIDYIHHNPVRSKLVSEADKYNYSSYNFYHNNYKRFSLILHNDFD
ncbi:transposase [Proteinivorax tanatarense]|uniref:Transposase n=1 Tax=Proteinivorax tanatarense TaxID=1260629 RepID=A0AAU7VN36_9FIRM